MNTPAGAKPLRRADLRALIAHLGRTERHARMKWSHLRTSGQLSALADGRSLVFQHPDPEQLGGGLPEEGEQTTVLFRVRGVSFRCDGQVRRLERSRRRLMIQPELIEWTVTGIRLPESRYCRRQARIGVRAPTRRLPWIEVLAVSEEEIYAVNWPRSKALARGQELQARSRPPAPRRGTLLHLSWLQRTDPASHAPRAQGSHRRDALRPGPPTRPTGDRGLTTGEISRRM
jgi:hypothetical protein